MLSLTYTGPSVTVDGALIDEERAAPLLSPVLLGYPDDFDSLSVADSEILTAPLKCEGLSIGLSSHVDDKIEWLEVVIADNENPKANTSFTTTFGGIVGFDGTGAYEVGYTFKMFCDGLAKFVNEKLDELR